FCSSRVHLSHAPPASAPLYRFLFTEPPPTTPHTLPLHDALPISPPVRPRRRRSGHGTAWPTPRRTPQTSPARRTAPPRPFCTGRDRKSTRLNSSDVSISYAVFCLKKKKKFQSRTHAYSTPAKSSS